MPIDPEKALGYEFPEQQSSWGPDDVILYHLGVGAGVPPTDPGELEYAYEKNLKVLPSYGVIPVFSELHRPIPTQAELTSRGRLAGLYDKGKAALAVVEVESSDAEGPLFTNRFSLFLRGEGGFGGEAGPKAGNQAPEREPDLVVETETLPQQALLYRLCGDKNPLHADPEFAKMGGFDQPILHGLCSFGIVCKAVVDQALEGDVTKAARYQARFAGVFFPGETMVTSVWKEGGKLLVASKSKERGTPVLSHAALYLRE